ncbi:MAG: RNA polymerase factor sigma-54 [Phycisphaerales bacterium]
MRFDHSQSMRMGQTMRLAPHMIQSMEILLMSQAELDERIDRELESNVTLEQGDGGEAGAEGGEGTEAAREGAAAAEGGAGEPVPGQDAPLELDGVHAEADFDRLNDYEEANPDAAQNEFDEARPTIERDYEDRRQRLNDGEPDAKIEAMANTAARSESLQEQLLEQWSLSEVEETIRPLGRMIISHIEDDGYLRTPLAEIVQRASPADWTPATRGAHPEPGAAPLPAPAPAMMERALSAVQLLLDPKGIGARDARECYLLQIDEQEAESDDDMAWSLTRRIVDEHFDDVMHNKLPRIAQRTGAGIAEVTAAIARLKTLSLRPGRRLVSEVERPITPDAFVEYDAENDRYYAYLNDRRSMNLRVNQEYALLAKDKTADKTTKEFIKTNLNNANFLLDAIAQRQRTIQRVVDVVVEEQREFFDFGPQAIKPLPMTKVGERLGIHVATVSRAVAEKYLQTPRGIVALRKFFTGGTTNEAGEEVSWEAIKAAMQEVVDGEDKGNPLSDDQIAEELKKRGLEIARRTVAKYRGQLGIATGRLRKTY